MTTHPSILRWSVGTTATTLRGKLRFALTKCRERPRATLRPGLARLDRGELHEVPRVWGPRQPNSTKRYANDTKYRRSENAKLRACLLKGQAYSGPAYPANVRKTLPLVPISWATAEAQGEKLCHIGKNATVQADYRTRLRREPGQTEWKRGRPVSYTRCKTINYIRSFADVRRKDRIKFYLSTACRTLVAPEGYTWSVDNLGLRLLRSDGADFHPEAGDLIRGVSYCIEQLAANAETRLRQLQHQARDKAEQEKTERALKTATARGVRVGLSDSLTAGNCRVGTENFAARHRLNPARWYNPKELLSVANGDAQRVRLAVLAAVRRHDRLADAGATILYPTT